MMKKKYQGVLLLCISAMFFLMPYINQKWVDRYSVSGQMLVLPSALSSDDNIFAKSVIFITRHDLLGAFGIMVNRLDHDVEIGDQTVQVFYGGPVDYDKDIYYIIHSSDMMTENSQRIKGKGLFIAKIEGYEALKNLEHRKMIIAKGYTGWGIRQLDKELYGNNWHVLPYNPNWIFDVDKASLWGDVIFCIKNSNC